MGSRLERSGKRLTDFQTAQLGATDKGWTTWGEPEERRGGPASYLSPHLRYRDYHADLIATVVLRLESPEETPTLGDIAQAIDRPKRPLFIGRKPCLPSGRMMSGWLEADSILLALQALPAETLKNGRSCEIRAQWPDGEGELPGDRLLDLCDERNWSSGMHGGWRPVREGMIRPQEGCA